MWAIMEGTLRELTQNVTFSAGKPPCLRQPDGIIFNPDSEFQEIFAYGIRNPGFWNPEFNPRNRESR